jgi:hypothetical protein
MTKRDAMRRTRIMLMAFRGPSAVRSGGSG